MISRALAAGLLLTTLLAACAEKDPPARKGLVDPRPRWTVGETFRIRTRKYYRPVVLIQDAFDEALAPPAVGEDVVVEVPAATSQPVEKLLPRENTHEAILGTTAYVSPLTGVAIVRVHRR